MEIENNRGITSFIGLEIPEISEEDYKSEIILEKELFFAEGNTIINL